MPKKDFYTVTREEAASILSVSTRTLDRYVKSKKLRSKLSPSRNILIHAKDLEKLSKKPLPKKSTTAKKTTAPKVEQAPHAETIEIETENVEEKVFRDLYEEANSDLKAKQEKLEAASFRVGQLEAQLKNSVPLLEHKQKEQELDSQNSVLKQKLVASILKSWVFLGVAIVAAVVAGALGFLLYL
jgi:hypothetical protein